LDFTLAPHFLDEDDLLQAVVGIQPHVHLAIHDEVSPQSGWLALVVIHNEMSLWSLHLVIPDEVSPHSLRPSRVVIHNKISPQSLHLVIYVKSSSPSLWMLVIWDEMLP
jgi:hypothetical protein